MKTLTFLRPDKSGLDRLIEDDSIRSVYTDSLALIHDLICEFAEDQGRPRFRDQGDLIARINALSTTSVLAQSPAEVDRGLLENIEQNAERAIELRNEAKAPRSLDDGSALREEIAEFLDSLISTYRDAIQPRTGGAKPPRSART
jgi:hypothetical protein